MTGEENKGKCNTVKRQSAKTTFLHTTTNEENRSECDTAKYQPALTRSLHHDECGERKRMPDGQNTNQPCDIMKSKENRGEFIRAT